MIEDLKTSQLDEMLEIPSFEEEYLSSQFDYSVLLRRPNICPKCGGSMIEVSRGKYACPKIHDIEDDNQSYFNDKLLLDQLDEFEELSF